MHHAAGILLILFIVFVAAKVGAEIAQRLKMPGVVGEIVAGAVIGPSVLGWINPEQIADGTPLAMLSQLGVVLLLFAVGLETRMDDLKKVGKTAFLVAICGVILPFVVATIWAHGQGFVWVKSLFVAAAFVATSAGITARVLQELGVLGHTESRIILGAAVIDDVLGMLLLGVVSSLQGGGEIHLGTLLMTLAGAVGFLVVVGWAGIWLMQRKSHWLDKLADPDSALIMVLALCLGISFLSTKFGLAAIIGAFLAGMIVSEAKQRDQLEEKTMPLLGLLTPFFFVVTGAKVDIHLLASWDTLWMLFVVTVLAFLTKLVGCGLGAWSLGPRGATIVGVGMVPRGEVGIVIAALGLATGIFTQQVYAVIVAMSLLTSVLTPPILAVLFRRQQLTQSP